MGTSSLLFRLAFTATLGTLAQFGDASVMGMLRLETNATPNLSIQYISDEIDDSVAAPKLKCKAGYKAGTTPISLIPGAKVSCVNTKTAAVGKKLFTGFAKSCFACHSMTGPNPVSQTNPNLRNQGFTLKSTDIMSAFNLHSSQMLGATITAKDTKSISAYLQTIK